jgi:hypothetical protein
VRPLPLVCPYCYLSFSQRKILFRCNGQFGPDGHKCGISRDDPLYQRFGLQDALPPTFSAGSVSGRRSSAECPDCRSRTYRRICPFCHSQLPPHFGKVRHGMIVMIGAKESGKTVYLTVLLHELRYTVGRRFDLSVQGSDDHTRGWLEQQFKHGLYGDGELPDTTRTADAQQTQPLVFSLQMPGRGLVGRPKRETIMSFFDTAGEDLTTREGVELNTRYLTAADGVILLLDPLQMPGVREHASRGSTRPGIGPGPGPDAPLNVLSRVTDLLRGTSGRAKKIKVPMAVAFSKLDTLWNSFEPGSPLAQKPPEEKPVLDLGDCEAVHDHVRSLLHSWDYGQIDQLLRLNYGHYSFFGLSALGEATSDGQVVGGVRPYRVEDPFLWLLGRLGAIPTQHSGRRKQWLT